MSQRRPQNEKRITEKCESAQREWLNKVEVIKKENKLIGGKDKKRLQGAINEAGDAYIKLFGRIGIQPLLTMKGGRQRPRYLLDRDEVWMMYKPSLWEMGGRADNWERTVRDLRTKQSTLVAAQTEYMSGTAKAGNLQEWHGLTQGTSYIPDPRMSDEKVFQDFGFVQRLDVETDGPVMVAKTYRAQRVMHSQMQTHLFSKAYMCLVHGKMENKIQYINGRFGPLGQEGATQIMLKSAPETDPFHEVDYNPTTGKSETGRNSKPAKTFMKPMAYYTGKNDNSEYTLVYVNILTGITHQIRITMQSVGHPIVSDDRYLPKEQAVDDLRWCPRNFLTEVRSDWFDVFGPHKDAPRRSYTRVSVENPLPQLLQNVLTTRLTLTEKLDPTADLFQGPQYWGIGDEQLMTMNRHPEEFCRKVTRWGIRRGIHLDCLDRLLLLPMAAIRGLLQEYKPPDQDATSWICPECFVYNKDSMECKGGAGIGECKGRRLLKVDQQPAQGWKDWLEDPTLHFIMTVNLRWNEERSRVFDRERPVWEKPPVEFPATQFTEDIQKILEACLILDCKKGGFGIKEEEFRNYPGLEDIALPLGEPPEDSNIRRMRLFGRGFGSQWTFALVGRERIKYTSTLNFCGKPLRQPISTKTDALPSKMMPSMQEQKEQRVEITAEELKKKAETDTADENAYKLRQEKVQKRLDKEKNKRKWRKVEIPKEPGRFYYLDTESGETQFHEPEGYALWTRKESTSNPGKFYYLNSKTEERRVERPEGAEIVDDVKISKKEVPLAPEPTPNAGSKTQKVWERKESSSVPGKFYYFNHLTGVNDVAPPVIDLPWKLCESSSKKGQFYYFNEDSNENAVDPPAHARSAPVKALKRPAPQSPSGLDAPKPKRHEGEKIAEGWVKKESASKPGKYYYDNPSTGETKWDRPVWEKRPASSHPGKFYYQNVETGETSWIKK